MPPRVFLSDLTNHCLSFFWEENPNWYVGYRLIEGHPLITTTPAIDVDKQPNHIDKFWSPDYPCTEKRLRSPYPEWLNNFQPQYNGDPYHFVFNTCLDGSARCEARINQGEQTLEWTFKPVSDGVWITLQVTTRTPLPGGYGLQQCLRFTGSNNEYWRRKVAHTPFLSEFDLQAIGQPNLTLSYARQNDHWLEFPVPYTILFTLAGSSLPNKVDHNNVDHGLIIRQTIDRKLAPDWYQEITAPGATWDMISAGMYWERTLFISNRHPADCLHAIVDFGPLESGERRTLYGKFYWVEGTKDDLLANWRKDFK